MKLIGSMFVLPALKDIVIINREKLNVPLYISNVEDSFWIGKEQDKSRKVYRGQNYFEAVEKNNFEERIDWCA